MRYLKETFRYLKSTWWLLALLCLPAAVILGFFLRPVASVSFVPVYAVSDIQSFFDIIKAVIDPALFQMIWPPFLVFASLFLMLCVTLPLMEKHFRIGRLSARQPFSLMNHYFVPVLIITLIFGVILVLYFVLLISLTAFQHYVISGAGVPNAWSVAVATVLAVGMFILLCFLCTPFMFMIPQMQMYGYSFSDAFTSSVSYYGCNKPFRIMSGYVLIFMTVAGIAIIVWSLAAFIPPWVRILIAITLHLFLLVYFCAYTMVTTFSVTGMERKDLNRYGI